MGLDSVELVMEVEDQFDVQISDADASRVHTVADLAALVIARLPRVPNICPTARTFYAIRRLFSQYTGVNRHTVRPETSLEALFSSDRRRRWRILRQQERRLPRLESSPAINRLPSWLSGTIAAIGIGCVAAIWYYIDGWSAILFGIVFLIASVAVFSFLTYCLGTHWPHGITTVGHLTRAIAPFDVSDGPPGQRLLTHMKVLEEVRRLTAEQLGLPLDKVRAESDFVHDLKID